MRGGVGLLKALRREGIEIDLIVGCSGGSIYTEIIPILPRFERQIGSFDVHENPHIIEQGERAAEEQLLYIQRVLEIL